MDAETLAAAIKLSDITDTETIIVPKYTNLVPLSTDEDGKPYGENGLSANGNLSTSGEVVSGSLYVTGFIPVKKGDIIRVKDRRIEITGNFAMYSSSKTATKGIGRGVDVILNPSQAALGEATLSDDRTLLTWDTSTIYYYFWLNFSYVRITTTSPDAIVTVNEEIIDTEVEKKVLKTAIGVKRENIEFDIIDKPFKGRNIVFFGDSIFGNTRDSTSVPAIAGDFVGATAYNVGFGGCRMSTHPTTGYAAFSMYKLADAIATGTYTEQETEAASGASYFTQTLATLKAIDFSAVDTIVIHYGSNDMTGDVKLDNADDDDDTSTYCGAARYAIRKIQAAYPKIRIFLSLPLYRTWDDGGAETHKNSLGLLVRDYCTALSGVAEEFNLPVIDGYRNNGYNASNITAFTIDNAHLNDRGRKVFGEYIGGCLL